MTCTGFTRTATGLGESVCTNSEPEPRKYSGAEAALIKGFAGQVWALHMALEDPVWDRCKTFLPRNSRAENRFAGSRHPECFAKPPPMGRTLSFSRTLFQVRHAVRHPLLRATRLFADGAFTGHPAPRALTNLSCPARRLRSILRVHPPFFGASPPVSGAKSTAILPRFLQKARKRRKIFPGPCRGRFRRKRRDGWAVGGMPLQPRQRGLPRGRRTWRYSFTTTNSVSIWSPLQRNRR